MAIQENVAVYVTAVSIGMLHGVEPGHGWPVAAIFALRRRHRWWYGVWAAVILGIAHLTSSFAVVALYAVANHFWKLDSLDWMSYVAGGLLLLMALRQWRSGGHHHHHHQSPAGETEERSFGGLLGLAGFAFALGFVHEEEFAIIALAAGKANPWLVMGVYAVAVAVSLVLLTVLAIATLNRFERKLHRFEHFLPRISAGILGGMGVAYILRWL
jgi:ABC-type nickel/cobalt efflux system permease component RcnA